MCKTLISIFQRGRKHINKFKSLIFEEKHEDKSKAGILMMIIATICFSIMVLLVKYLSHYPLAEIIFFRSLAIMLFIPPILKKNKIPLLGNNRFF